MSLIGLLSLALQYENYVTEKSSVSTFAVCEFNH